MSYMRAKGQDLMSSAHYLCQLSLCFLTGGFEDWDSFLCDPSYRSTNVARPASFVRTHVLFPLQESARERTDGFSEKELSGPLLLHQLSHLFPTCG